MGTRPVCHALQGWRGKTPVRFRRFRGLKPRSNRVKPELDLSCINGENAKLFSTFSGAKAPLEPGDALPNSDAPHQLGV